MDTNYLETIKLYFEQGAYESASLVCENAFKATESDNYLIAAEYFAKAHAFGLKNMQSECVTAAQDALVFATSA